jgi:uncharacterized protein
VVKVGDIVKVRVMEVDVPRKRIGLSCRLDDAAPRPARGERTGAGPSRGAPSQPRSGADRGARPAPKAQPAPANNALAEAFARAKRG